MPENKVGGFARNFHYVIWSNVSIGKRFCGVFLFLYFFFFSFLCIIHLAALHICIKIELLTSVWVISDAIDPQSAIHECVYIFVCVCGGASES